MKYLALVLAAIVSFSVFAETDYRAMEVIRDIQKGTDNGNQIDVLRVRTSAVLPAGSVSTAEIADDAITAAKVGVVAQVYTGTPAIVATTFTPAFVGQLLIGTISNTLHIAKGSTTNDWFAK